MAEVSSIVLFSKHPNHTIAFYRSVGLDFEEEDHGDGMVHAATEVGEIHVAVLPEDDGTAPPPWRAGGSTFVGFYVDSLDETLDALCCLNTPLLVDHQVREWGCRVVVEDPDGRAVEINQRGHCGAGGVA